MKYHRTVVALALTMLLTFAPVAEAQYSSPPTASAQTTTSTADLQAAYQLTATDVSNAVNAMQALANYFQSSGIAAAVQQKLASNPSYNPLTSSQVAQVRQILASYGLQDTQIITSVSMTQTQAQSALSFAQQHGVPSSVLYLSNYFQANGKQVGGSCSTCVNPNSTFGIGTHLVADGMHLAVDVLPPPIIDQLKPVALSKSDCGGLGQGIAAVTLIGSIEMVVPGAEAAGALTLLCGAILGVMYASAC